jgi:hypothetical protein
MMGAMRRFALYGLGLLLAFALALTYTTTGRAKADSRVSHTCSATDHAFLDTARTNMAAIDLWGQEYLDGDMGAGDVAAESARAAKIVGATAPTDPSLAQARTLLVAMFAEYRNAMEQRAKHRDSGDQIYHAYALANFAHNVLAKAAPALDKRGCDVSALI